DGHGRIDSAETGALPANLGANPARRHPTAQKKNQESVVQLILGHYTSNDYSHRTSGANAGKPIPAIPASFV
ncbi:MAG TPA: hypothetical protein VGO67_24450, partial [Verrucomicrobiae bacterium]